jgi:ComF family protein
LKDLLFPIFCIECKKEGEWWCDDCLKKLNFSGNNSCPVCAIATEQGNVCYHCKAVSYLDGITALFNYKESSLITKLLQLLKYQGVQSTTAVWKNIFSCWLKEVQGQVRFDNTIIPVPLHHRRQRERGFNQSSFLAEILISTLPSKVEFDNQNLVKIKYTKQQMKLSAAERRINLKDVFKWRGEQFAPQRVLLIDDIYTTGSTMQECAKVLKQHGTQEVWGFVLARD